MIKKGVFILIIIVIIAISGCTTKASNGTFGEKTLSIDSIYLSDNTTSDIYKDKNKNVQYYYINGYLVNNNSNDAFNVKVVAKAYDANGNLVATNDSAYIKPTTIPAKGISEFYIDFPDDNNNIVKYDVKIVSASGTL